LRLAGITAQTPDPVGGVIVRLPGGKEPAGVLRDTAMDLVAHLVPAPSGGAIAEAVRAALNELRRQGVTSVQDMDGSDAPVRRALFRLYQHLARTGRLTARVRLYWPLAAWRDLGRVGVALGFG